MTISVIVPIYNVEPYIQNSINSIRKQSYHNLEIILIDDGSTDRSGIMADEYAKEDERIQVIHKKNGGLSDARNRGIEQATGDYICFVDSDDTIHHDYIDTMVKLVKEYQCDIVQCAFMRTGETTVESTPVTDATVQIYSNLEMLDNIYSAISVETIVAWNKLYKRELFDTIRFPLNMLHEDEATTYQVIFKAEKIVRTSAVLYFYYQNNTGIMNSAYNIRHLDILKALEIRRHFFKDHQLVSLYYKDTYKYICKILIQYDQVAGMESCDKMLLKQLRNGYWKTYTECKSFPWSLKRKAGLFFFGCFPKWYVPMVRKNND